MKSALLIVVLTLFLVAATPLQRKKDKWDIAEGLTGAEFLGKFEGHEGTVREAWKMLTADEQSQITNPTTADRPALESMHHPPAIIMGIQYPDMPMGGKSTQMMGDDMTSADHVNVVTFAALFMVGKKGARNTFISQSHFGCLQFWHAMAPEPFVGDNYKVWSNRDMSTLLKNFARRVYTVATTKIIANDKNLAEFHLGRLLHTIGDSYAPGHVVRAPGCGSIYVFQEYNAQKGNEEHGEGDKPDKNKELYKCSIQKINAVLKSYAACAKAKTASACAYPAGVIDAIFDVAPEAAEFDAGGALLSYKGPSATDKKTMTVDKKKIDVYFPPMGTSKRVQATANLEEVCAHFT